MQKIVEHNGISLEEVSAFLLSKGYTVGSNKPSDYSGRGLMLRGMRNIDNGGSKAFKIYFSPVVIVEFMTASLLKKGNWQSLDARQTHTKLTDQDVFYGRLGAYFQIIKDNKTYAGCFGNIDKYTNLPLRHFSTDVTYWYPKLYNETRHVEPDRIICMDLESVCDTLQFGAVFLKSKYPCEEYVKAYLEWTKWQYLLTFLHINKLFMPEILKIKPTPVQSKVDEEKITEFHKNTKESLLQSLNNKPYPKSE